MTLPPKLITASWADVTSIFTVVIYAEALFIVVAYLNELAYFNFLSLRVSGMGFEPAILGL